MDKIIDKISKIMEEKYGIDGKKIISREEERADLSIRVFAIAKIKGEDIVKVGREVIESIQKIEGVENAEFDRGYVNIRIADSEIIEALDNGEKGEKYKRVIVEFPSVNPNKPWHVGHLRNALLGESVSRMLEYIGYEVERLNYINDLGLQVAESFYYYKKFKEECNEKFDHCIGKQYVKAHSLVEENEKIEAEVREILKKLEKGEEEGRGFIEKVLKSQYETANNFGICSDKAVFESDLSFLFEKGIEELKNKGAVYIGKGKNEGCVVIKVGEEEKVLVRSDGTLTYTGKDIIFHLWKLGEIKEVKFKESDIISCKKPVMVSSKEGEEVEEKGDLIINVIGIEQSYPQQVVKEAVSKLSEKANKIVHLAYAFVRLKDSRFSGRKGTWIGYTADELLEEGIKRVLEGREIDSSTAKKIALAAIKFAILKVSPKKEVIFDWDRVLSTEGDSGVYLLYSYVRGKSIIRKSKKQSKRPSSLKEERELLKKIILFDRIVEKSAEKYDPAELAHYLLDISKMFHKFYSKVRILGSDREEELLFVVKEYCKVMEKGMELLGIEVIDEM